LFFPPHPLDNIRTLVLLSPGTIIIPPFLRRDKRENWVQFGVTCRGKKWLTQILQNGSYLKRQKMLKYYKTIEAKWYMFGENVTNRIEAVFQKIGKKPKISQNQSSLNH
jgi:hypothetical protein